MGETLPASVSPKSASRFKRPAESSGAGGQEDKNGKGLLPPGKTLSTFTLSSSGQIEWETDILSNPQFQSLAQQMAAKVIIVFQSKALWTLSSGISPSCLGLPIQFHQEGRKPSRALGFMYEFP